MSPRSKRLDAPTDITPLSDQELYGARLAPPIPELTGSQVAAARIARAILRRRGDDPAFTPEEFFEQLSWMEQASIRYLEHEAAQRHPERSNAITLRHSIRVLAYVEGGINPADRLARTQEVDHLVDELIQGNAPPRRRDQSPFDYFYRKIRPADRPTREEAMAPTDFYAEMHAWVGNHGSQHLINLTRQDERRAKAVYVRERAAIEYPLFVMVGSDRHVKVSAKEPATLSQQGSLLALDPLHVHARLAFASLTPEGAQADPRVREAIGDGGEVLVIEDYLPGSRNIAIKDGNIADGMLDRSSKGTGYTLIRSTSMAGLRERLFRRLGQLLAAHEGMSIAEALPFMLRLDRDPRMKMIVQNMMDAIRPGNDDYFGSLITRMSGSVFTVRDLDLVQAYGIGSLGVSEKLTSKQSARVSAFASIAEEISQERE